MNIRNSMNVGNHEANQNPWWKRKLTRFQIPVWGFLAVLFLGALTALAVIFARADFTPTAKSGNVELAFSGSSSQVADRPLDDMEFYTWDGTTWNKQTALPTGVTCQYEITGGELIVTIDGLLTDERCRTNPAQIYNASSIDLSNLAFDMGAGDFVLAANGADGAPNIGGPAPWEVVDISGVTGTSLAAGTGTSAHVAFQPTQNDGVTYTDSLAITGEGAR